MRFPLVVPTVTLTLILAGCLNQVDQKVDKVTVLYGRVDVEMNYTGERLPMTREPTSAFKLRHCSDHVLRGGKMYVEGDEWNSEVSTIVVLVYSGDFNSIGNSWVQYIEGSHNLEMNALLNSSLQIYRMGPALEGHLEPLVPVKEQNGTWIVNYTVHNRDDTNQTYTVQETLSLEIYENVEVILEEPLGCD